MADPAPAAPLDPATRTEEMHASVRRRALPVAICGMICAIAGLVMTLTKPVTPFTPPDFIGMNLQFCAMLIGVGIFLYAKPTPGTSMAQAFSIFALLIGMGGTVFYTFQTIKLRTMREQYELDNVTAIVRGAREYAKAHEGKYPADILVLLENNLIKPQNLRSPFTMNKNSFIFVDYETNTKDITSREKLLQTIETASDYLYVGADMRLADPALEKDILIAVSNNTIMRLSLALCTADGKPRFIKAADVPHVMKLCNDAREKLGLGILRPPEIMRKVQEETAATQRRQ